jgi:hypothetical protein
MRVVFADFVAGRRKKREYDAPTRKLFPKSLDDRPPLLELSERSGVKPKGGGDLGLETWDLGLGT